MEEQLERLTLSESNESRIFKAITLTTSTSNEGEVTIKFSPSYKDVKEEILENMIHVHEHYFQWECVKGRNEIFEEFFKRNKSVTFVRSQHPKKQNSFIWTNQTHIDLSRLLSVHRILVIRDITQQLLDEKKKKPSKMLTKSDKTTVNFKLDDITFSLKLNPSKEQPGNALLAMKGNTGTYAATHSDVEDFDCFKNLDPKDIESIVRNARKTGKQITDSDINSSKQDKDRKKMAEEMNFFMLLYDFEVARRLQRPFTKESRNLDSLPIGIGIAMIHRINGKSKNETWKFFPTKFFPTNSSLFQGEWQSRKGCLHEIVKAFEECKEPSEVGTEAKHINERLLYEQFGSQECLL